MIINKVVSLELSHRGAPAPFKFQRFTLYTLKRSELAESRRACLAVIEQGLAQSSHFGSCQVKGWVLPFETFEYICSEGGISYYFSQSQCRFILLDFWQLCT